MTSELTHIDLFSGIGGFALAARWAGIKTVQFVEIDPFCQKVLKKNFPGVPIHDDIKTFTVDTYTEGARQLRTAQHENDGEDSNRGRGFDPTDIHKDIAHDIKTFTYAKRIGQFGSEHNKQSRHEEVLSEGHTGTHRPFLLTGGFPCQPFSCAGKRKGTADDRHLWPHMLRVIKEFNPEWIIGENVGGIINIKNLVEQGGDADMEDEADNGGEDSGSTSVLVSILSDLNQAGFAVQLFLLPAAGVGACHKRDRVWIVAHSTNSRVEGLRQERENPVFQNTGIISEGSGNTETEERGNGQSILAENVSRRPISNRGFGGIIAPDTKKPECEPSSTTRTGRDGLADNLDNAPDTEPERLQGHIQQQTKQTRTHCGCLTDCHAPDTEHNQASRHRQNGRGVLPITEPVRPDNGNQWEQDWYSVAIRTCVRGVDDGVSRGLHRVNRLKALGNAVVPQIPYLIMKAILEVTP